MSWKAVWARRERASTRSARPWSTCCPRWGERAGTLGQVRAALLHHLREAKACLLHAAAGPRAENKVPRDHKVSAL